MSADSTVTYTSVYSEARYWSIPSEDPYEEVTQQLLKQAPRSPEYAPDPIKLEDHVPVYIPKHPEDLLPAEDEAPIEAYIPEVAYAPTPLLPPSFLSPRIRPPHTRAAMDQMRAAVQSTYHSLLPSWTPPLIPIPLPVPSTSRKAEITEADTPPRKRLLLTAPRHGCEVEESYAAATSRQPGPTMARSVDYSFVDTMETRFQDTERRMMTALEMVNMRERERLVYEQESIQIHEALARSEAYSRTLEARVAVLETQARRHQWRRQTADDFAVQHIIRTQALEAGARIDTLEDTAILYSLLSITGNSRLKMAPKRTTRSKQVPPVTPAPTATTTTVTEAQLQALTNQGVAAVMAKEESNRVRNGYDNNGLGPRLAQAIRECTYPDFLKYQPLIFKGTRGVFRLTQWSRSYMVELPCEDCYSRSCSGIAIENFKENDDRQDLALICDQLFPEESDRVEKYIGGLPDMIHDSVKAARPKTMQEAIEFATELMDRSICEGGNDNAQARVYMVGNAGANPDNVIAGTFLLDNRYAYILFDTGADRSFVSTTFSFQINITPIALDHHYNVEIADGRIIGLNTIMRDCTLNFLNHPFNIDLLPVELGSFDVIIGMDWFSRYNAVIACAEKLVRIPFRNEIITIHGEGSNERNESRLNIISCSKAQEYMSKGCHVFLANITSTKDEDKSKGKRLEAIPVVREFTEVFPKDLPARAPYRLAPFEMKELADQLQELTDKGFIRLSSSPWGAPALLVKKKDGSFWICIDYQELNKLTDEKEHEEQLKAILELLKKEEFQGIHVDPAMIESVKDWATPKSPTEIHQFLGLDGYYRRFIEGFSEIAKPITKLTQKKVKFEWDDKQEAVF
nr:putative reverse transcriptase domain-containing protein [Tanacetum cinerariifolium]